MTEDTQNITTIAGTRSSNVGKSEPWDSEGHESLFSETQQLAPSISLTASYAAEVFVQDTNPVRYRTDSVSAVVQDIQEEKLFSDDGKEYNLSHIGKKKGRHRNAAAVRCILQAEDASLSRNPTNYEMAVYNAISSVYNAGNSRVTINQIAYALTGSNKRKVTAKEVESIDAAILRLSSIWAYIDFSEQIEGMQLSLFDEPEEIHSGVLSGRLLEFRKVELTTRNGSKAIGYDFLRAPILFEYSRSINQLATYPIRYLDVPELSNTQKNIVLKGYLLDRINRITKKGSRLSNRIRYDTITAHVFDDGNEISRTQKRRLREDVSICLNYWTKQGYIKGYSEYSSGRTIIGVELHF